MAHLSSVGDGLRLEQLRSPLAKHLPECNCCANHRMVDIIWKSLLLTIPAEITAGKSCAVGPLGHCGLTLSVCMGCSLGAVGVGAAQQVVPQQSSEPPLAASLMRGWLHLGRRRLSTATVQACKHHLSYKGKLSLGSSQQDYQLV